MPQKVGTVTSELILDTRRATQAYQRFERTVARNRGRDSFMSGISADAKDFENSLGKATNRVVAFGAAAAVFTTISKAAYEFAQAIVEVDNSLAKINVNLGQSQAGLKKFGADLFNIARQTGQTFEVTAKAAEELARQGLGAEETTKRLKDALILSRIAGLDSASAVDTLTAAINSFNEEALTSTEVVNKFAAVDTKFAVSSRDLAEAVSRVGSTAQSAGVGINELIGLVTSLQQTTARGGATIGNGLKTIFTRIQAAPETVQALESVGVAIKNTDGSLRDALSILRDYGSAREKVGEVERAALDRTVAGTFQINILKAALTDLNKEYSVYGNAVRTAAGATDEAIRKNEQLNETIASLINSTAVSIKQFFANIGGEKIGVALQGILKGFERIRAFFSGDSGSELGKSLGEGLLQGISNVLSGPALGALTIILFQAFAKVIKTIAIEARTLLSLNSAAQARAVIQKQINVLLAQATDAERAQYAAASSVLAKKEQILAIQARINQESLAGTPLVRSFQVAGSLNKTIADPRLRGGKYLGVPTFADPIGAAVKHEIAAGAPANQIYVDRDARVASFANPLGLLVANRRDEPLGGYQGVNRVLSQGGNPKTNGIPGFAATRRNPFDADAAETQKIIKSLNEQSKGFGSNLHALNLEIKETVNQIKAVANPTANIARLQEQNRISYENNIKLAKQGLLSDKLYSMNGSQTFPGPASLYPPDPVAQSYGRKLSTRERYYQRQTNARYDAKYEGLSPQEVAMRAREARGNQEAARRQVLRDALQVNAKETAERKLATIEQRRQSRSNKTLGAAFALPFLSGLVEPTAQSLGVKTGGGTTGGVVTGALSLGAQFGGAAALTGNPAIAGGAAIVGALIGAFSKLRKSSEELGAELDEASAKRGEEADAVGRVRALREQIKDAESEGASPAVLRKLNDNLLGATSRVTSVQGQAVLNAKPGADQDEAQRQFDAGKSLKDASKSIADILAGRAKGKVSTAITQGLNSDIISSLTPDKLAALRRAGSTDFNVKANIDSESGNISNLDEVTKAQEAFKQSLADTKSVLGPFADDIQLTQENLQQFARDYVSGALQFKKIMADIATNKTPAGGLGRDAFINRPNKEPYAQAGLLGRLPKDVTTRNQRSRGQFDLFQELFSSGTVKEETLTGASKDLFSKSKASVQNENLLDAILAFVEKALPGAEGVRTDRGEANASGLKGALKGLSKRKGDTGTNAQFLLEQLDKGQATLTNAGIKTEQPSSGYNLPRGVKYSTYAPGQAGGFNGYDASQQLADKERARVYFAAHANTGRSGFTVSNTTGLPGAPAVGRNGSISQATLDTLPSEAQTAQQTAAARDADIDSYLKIAEDAKVAAQTAASALQQTLNIVVSVNGAGDPETLAAIQSSIQTLFDRQAAASGRPNPPAPPAPLVYKKPAGI